MAKNMWKSLSTYFCTLHVTQWFGHFAARLFVTGHPAAHCIFTYIFPFPQTYTVFLE